MDGISAVVSYNLGKRSREENTLNRLTILSLLIVVSGSAVFLAGSAQSQVGPPKDYVNLQSTTPGSSQAGHANINGTLRAGALVGNGAGITNVDADLFDGLNSSSFLQSVPLPLTLIGNNSSYIILGSNSATVSSAAAVVGESTATTGASSGVFGRSSATSGKGVLGEATSLTGNNYGVQGLTFSASGFGVYGLATNGGSGFASGVFGESYTSTGRGIIGFAQHATGATYGGYFISASTAGTGVYGQSGGGSGSGYGGHFLSYGTSGVGVVGQGAHVSGINYGGRFSTLSPNGYGAEVVGPGPDALLVSNTGFGRGIKVDTTSDTAIWATAGNAFAGIDVRNGSTTNYGVFGQSTATTGTGVGVVGQTNSATGWGVFSFGPSGASGTKSFRIDHPAEPESKYLLHYSSESPVPQNFYLGNATTDEKGYAWIELPDYFAEINANFKYQLTIVDESDSAEFIWAKVVRKVVGNRFRIRTNLPNIEVSWRVDADRNDPYVRANPTKDVIEKSGREIGTYQHPELFGQPKDRGVNFRGR